jgi:HEAT repeat protein
MPLIRNNPGKDPSALQKADAARMLASGSADERWAAARHLAAAPGNTGLLGDALAREQDTRVREALFTALAHIGSDEAAQIVLPYIQTPDAAIRTQSIDALCAMPNAVQPHMNTLLSSADPDVRLLGCEIVRRLAAPVATDLLCRLLEHEADANVCAAAVEVLAEVGQPAALPVLARCAERFSGVDFLTFAIEIAATRVRSGEPGAKPA